MESKYLSTRAVAKLLGMSPAALTRSVWEGRVDAPQKGPGGAFYWTGADIEKASWVIRHKSADDILTDQR